MSMVQWKFNKFGQGDTPTCEHWYYRKCDTRIAASIHVRDCNDIEKELATRGLEFTHVLKVNVEPADFMRDVYYSLIGHTLSSVQRQICRECATGFHIAKSIHRLENGRMVRGRNILKDYWDVTMDVVQDMLVVQVFYNCWKKLNLHLTDGMAHLIALKTKLKDNLQKEVSKILEVDLGQHPVSLMVREPHGTTNF